MKKNWKENSKFNNKANTKANYFLFCTMLLTGALTSCGNNNSTSILDSLSNWDNSASISTPDDGPALLKKPNILTIVTDHTLSARMHLDKNGKSLIQRPVYEEFVQEAVDFTSSHSICPICSPARRSIDTAVYPHKHGINNNTQSVTGNMDYEPYYGPLQREGYQQYHVGKWHAGGNHGNAETEYKDYGLEGITFNKDKNHYGNPYLFEEYDEYCRQLGINANDITMTYDLTFNNKNINANKGKEIPLKDMSFQGMFSGTLNAPKEAHESFFISSLACDKLEEYSKQEDGQPFNLRVDIYSPHQPYHPTQEFLDMYEGVNIPQYPNFDENVIENEKPPVYLWCKQGNAFTTNGMLNYPNTLGWDPYAQFLKYAYAQQSQVDAAVGTILDKLEETGLDKNTIVVWTTDHGDSLASHGGQIGKDSYMTEEILQTFLAIRYPGVTNGKKSNALVNSADIPATIVDIVGGSWANEIDGKSLLPILLEEKEFVHPYQVSVHNSFGADAWSPNRARTIWEGNYKYTFNLDSSIIQYYPNLTNGYFEELYDLEKDPYELHNLAYDENFKSVKDQLKDDLISWQILNGDEQPLIKL